MVRRAVAGVVGLVVVGGLSFVGGPVGAVVPWALIGYVTWRAWPGMRADFARIKPGRLSVGGLRRRGGERL